MTHRNLGHRLARLEHGRALSPATCGECGWPAPGSVHAAPIRIVVGPLRLIGEPAGDREARDANCRRCGRPLAITIQPPNLLAGVGGSSNPEGHP